MNAYVLPISCSHCGSDLHHLSGATCASTEATGIVKCRSCSRTYAVLIHLRPVVDPRSEARRGERVA